MVGRGIDHGKSGTRVHRIWKNMKGRCQNPNKPDYPRYGGRGITVCERWQAFSAFYADMGEPPSPKHQIDRIDNMGPYAPENCRWVTITEQANNKRNNHLVTWQGRTLTVAQWAAECGLDVHAIKRRLKAGWQLDKVFSQEKFRSTSGISAALDVISTKWQRIRKSKTCKNGHPRAKFGKPRGNGWYCSECSRLATARLRARKRQG